ncbi:MAG TPA: extracellular solute-binding protein [Chthonomonadaceae bacterium]|nr:extracellular solute-binding protein [Chthonomonadaceae bacterium]
MLKNSRKRFLPVGGRPGGPLLTCLLVVLLGVLGLGPARADRVRLVVWGMESSSETKDMDAKIAAFEQRHPEIEVAVLSMGAGAMNPQKLMTAIVGGVPPDLVRQDRFTIGDWASRDTFRPLDDLLAADARSNDPLAVRQKDYVPATWAETIYQGHVYAIPDTTDDRVLYYNRALFREAGLNPDRPPQTWDELIADAKQLTKRAPSGGFENLGFVPLFSQGWLYLWSWQEDGEAMSPDGRHCTLDNPQTVQALTALVSWYDALGGVDAVNAFAGGFGDNAQDPFILGKLAMRVDTDGFLNSIARYKPDLDFGVCPAPVPAERLHHEGLFKRDPTWVTWSGGFSFAIPRGARHVREAWEFIQWMNSPEAALIGARAQAAYTHSLNRQYVPRLFANVQANKVVFAAYKNTLPPRFLRARQLCMDLLPFTKFRPVTFVGQRLWDEQVRAVDRALRHTQTPEQSLAAAQKVVNLELDAVYTRDRHPLLPSGAVAAGLALLALAGFLALGVGAARWMKARGAQARSEARSGFLFVLPWVIGFLVFTAGPILASLVLSFCDYDVLHPARWAGLSNYVALGTMDRPLILKSLYNAAYLAVIGIPLGMMTSLAMALLLNTDLRGQRWYRTFFYMPSIVPVVATSVLWSFILNSDPNRGLINAAWQATLSAWFHIPPPGWLAVPSWAKPGLIVMGLWGAGGGMILWLAGLQSIPSTLYEAASLDGAGWWAQFRHVTLPMLSPYIFFNLIMSTIGALQTFETAYILGGTSGGQSTGPDDSLLVPVVYLFNNAFQYFKMGYASALAWILFILILGLTLGQLKLAPHWVHYEVENK